VTVVLQAHHKITVCVRKSFLFHFLGQKLLLSLNIKCDITFKKNKHPTTLIPKCTRSFKTLKLLVIVFPSMYIKCNYYSKYNLILNLNTAFYYLLFYTLLFICYCNSNIVYIYILELGNRVKKRSQVQFLKREKRCRFFVLLLCVVSVHKNPNMQKYMFIVRSQKKITRIIFFLFLQTKVFFFKD